MLDGYLYTLSTCATKFSWADFVMCAEWLGGLSLKHLLPITGQ